MYAVILEAILKSNYQFTKKQNRKILQNQKLKPINNIDKYKHLCLHPIVPGTRLLVYY